MAKHWLFDNLEVCPKTMENILQEIDEKGEYVFHPDDWCDETQESISQLESQKIIQSLDKTNPTEMNSEYRYIRISKNLSIFSGSPDSNMLEYP